VDIDLCMVKRVINRKVCTVNNTLLIAHIRGNDGVRTERRVIQRSIHRLGSECTSED